MDADNNIESAGPLAKLWGDEAERGAGDPALVIDVAGFEGPLDLLLHLARNQKVDLARISVLALVEQYLTFIEQARKIRIELAADYLVMAAWLAYLKSRLLIPQPPKDDGPSGEEMAASLAFRLKRLEAMRDAAEKLVNRDRLGRDFFPRGAPEHIAIEKRSAYDASLYDLLTAYASLRQRQSITNVVIARRKVWSLAEAKTILFRMIGEIGDWVALDSYLIRYVADPEERRTMMASTFAASLEMARERRIELRQDGAFQPIFLRPGDKSAEAPDTELDN
jgi:segregation and condensation protein A